VSDTLDMGLFDRLVRWLEDILFPIRMRLGRKIMWSPQRKIVQISHSTLVKGPVSRQELEAMQFVATSGAGVSLPAIRRTYDRPDGLFLAMEFVRGARVDNLWPKLDEEQRLALVKQVQAQLQASHSVVKPKGLEGIVVGTAIRGVAMRDGIWGDSVVGPFATLPEFCDFARPTPNLAPFSRFFRTDRDRKNDSSVLCHADVCPRNIIIREVDGTPCIIDWEFGGWWPPWWEYIKWHFADFPELPGWVEMMDDVSGMT
jgi:aminoglycoside phosphotransferase (APT) family kinase protein